MPKQQAPSLMGRALRYLSRREHSRQELRKKLLPYAESDTELDELMTKLEAQSWLSDERFAESLVRRKSERYGSLKIVDELKQQGIEGDSLLEIKERLKISDATRAWELWQRKFDSMVTKDPKEKSKQMRYLVSKGFPLSVVTRIVDGRFSPSEEDSR
ncbi:recombination regulator RecX [Polynucleobacter sp. AM-26B4]|jgi:regulatory protein|uniref:recombination regulator RecX n=1 Tax=Polynucleobacter sp. AM-26B4 TaxID=2689103 RepID=UPI001C0C5AC3|nr:recombination regulator RecX [Polynucleobacter sp. AM-26B4]MBU3585627.1 recombination regulator RecX [Polynucleobacter sp. AM-26B4]